MIQNREKKKKAEICPGGLRIGWRLRTSMIVALNVLFFLLAGASLVALTSVRRIERLNEADRNLDRARYAGQQAVNAIQEQYVHQARALIACNAEDLDLYEKARDKVDAQLDELAALSGKMRVRGQIERIIALQAEMNRYFMETVAPTLETHCIFVRSRMNEHLENLIGEASRIQIDLNLGLDEENERLDGELSRLTRRVGFASKAAVGTAAVLAGAIILAFGYWTVPALDELRGAATRMSEGDLKTRVLPRGPMEFRDLARTFNSMAQALEKSREELARGERLSAIGRVAAGVAHEINNPIGVILGYLKVLKRQIGDPQAAGDLKVIEEEARLCEKIVRDLRDLAGPGRSDRQAVDLANLVRDAARRFRESKEAAGADIQTVLPESPVTVFADEGALRQIFYNLMRNAVQANGRDNRVIVRLREVPREACVEVEDMGPGIREEDFEKLFEPFYTTKARGSGLGLALCRQMAEANDGRVWADNGEGGARFTVAFPKESNAAAARRQEGAK